ncbi:MAG TPA: ABC transporter permease, partial [Planctomycetota bacterium]|nr:ABC transporter permease [Planctomycetota bacterium]
MQLQVLRLGVKNLLLHKLRSFLTVLGLLFGVASVISMLAVGEGASHEALEQIKAMGPTNVMVRTQRPPDTTDVSKVERKRAFSYGLKYVDAEKIRATLPRARHVVSVRETRSLVRHGARLMNSIVVGTQPEYESVMNLAVAEGRWLSAVDVGRVENCAVLGAQAATTLFPLGNPLGESVQCGTARFSVIGVLEPMGREASPGGMAMDQCLFVPITSSRSRFGDEIRRVTQGSEERTRIELNEIKVELETTEEVLPAARLLGSMLEIGQRAQDDVRIIVPLELLRQKEATARIFNLVLGCIAVISLLVGGIGIMNVMLATVTERTREIG